MTIPKVSGIETEYGIMILAAQQPDPFLASRLLLSAYQHSGGIAAPCHSYHFVLPSIDDDNVSETAPSRIDDCDATDRGRSIRGQQFAPPEHFRPRRARVVAYDETDLMLPNGARFYIDHAHPEYSTPECLSARQLLAADKAGERILGACQQWINTSGILSPDQRILVYKNNGDYKNNSYGCHEEYLLSSELYNDLLYSKMHKVFRYLLPFFVTRIIFCGSGKVGAENNTSPAGFQLSQRTDFFETLIGLQTTYNRPIFNTRDEAHADTARFRRLHVIPGDANMAEYSTYLKIGTTQLILHMLEDDFITTDLTLNDPVQAMQAVSRDLTFKQPLQLEGGRQMTALDIQRFYLELARKYLEEKGASDEQLDVVDEWEDALDMLPDDWEQLATRLDWAIKKRLLDRYLATQGAQWSDVAAWQVIIEEPDQSVAAREKAKLAGLAWNDYERQRELYFGLRRLDLQYHDIRYDATQGEVGLYYHLQQKESLSGW